MYSQSNNTFDVKIPEPNLSSRKSPKPIQVKVPISKAVLNLIDGGDSIGSVSDRYSGVLLARMIAEQQDLLAARVYSG
jgi:hypothetical protein